MYVMCNKKLKFFLNFSIYFFRTVTASALTVIKNRLTARVKNIRLKVIRLKIV